MFLLNTDYLQNSAAVLSTLIIHELCYCTEQLGLRSKFRSNDDDMVNAQTICLASGQMTALRGYEAPAGKRYREQDAWTPRQFTARTMAAAFHSPRAPNGGRPRASMHRTTRESPQGWALGQGVKFQIRITNDQFL